MNKKINVLKMFMKAGVMVIFFTLSSCTPNSQSNDAIIDASDFPTLQAAFDALPVTGGEVIIPPGEYELTEPLVLLNKENTHIRGAGPSTHLINRNENGEPAFIIKPDSDDQNTYIWRIQISDFRISGNEKSGDGLLADRVNELYITGLCIDHHGEHGISTINCVEDARINHCIITYNAKVGLYILGDHDIIVSANQFEENQDALHFIDACNLTMTGNNIDDHQRHGVVMENTYGGSLISGNMIEECQGTAIILDRSACGTTISGNALAHNAGGGVDLRDAWNCAISSNTFTNNYNFSVMIGSQSGRHSISGNSITNSYRGGGETKWPYEPRQEGNIMSRDGGIGIILDNTSDIAITGNFFGGLETEAVKANSNCNRILVLGNVITDLGRRAIGPKTAIDMGGAKESTVKGNIIERGLIVKE